MWGCWPPSTNLGDCTARGTLGQRDVWSTLGLALQVPPFRPGTMSDGAPSPAAPPGMGSAARLGQAPSPSAQQQRQAAPTSRVGG